jgi:CheY-like chemotaxis protein
MAWLVLIKLCVDSRARILIVDDHEVLLNALRMGMRADRNRWDVEFVASSQTALDAVQQRHFDVIVSDLEMPGVAGWGLLASVKELSPDTARIVMSGLSDKDTLAKVAPYMHRYLPKPCSLRELRESIAQVCSHRPGLADRALADVIGGAELPSAPLVYLELRTAAANAVSSLGDLAQIICRDPGLAAKVLQLANSAYFGVSGPAGDVETAVSRLGLDMTLTLAVSAHIFSLGSDDPHVPPRYRVTALQRAAVASASWPLRWAAPVPTRRSRPRCFATWARWPCSPITPIGSSASRR